MATAVGQSQRCVLSGVFTDYARRQAGDVESLAGADILGFILQFHHFPAGRTELTARDEILQQIRFDNPAASQ